MENELQAPQFFECSNWSRVMENILMKPIPTMKFSKKKTTTKIRRQIKYTQGFTIWALRTDIYKKDCNYENSTKNACVQNKCQGLPCQHAYKGNNCNIGQGIGEIVSC